MAQTPCKLRQHPGDYLDYTPGADVAAGDVVVIGSTLVTIAPLPISAGVKGAVATRGIYNVPKDNSNITAPAAVYWDDDADPVGGTAGSGAFTSNSALGPFAGWALEAAGTSVGDVDIYLSSRDSGAIPGTFAHIPTTAVTATGTVQGNAAALSTGFNLVSAGDGNKGVILPAAAAGKVCVIKNAADAALKVYPNTSDAINELSANANYSMTNLSSAMFIAYDATTWYTTPLVAS